MAERKGRISEISQQLTISEVIGKLNALIRKESGFLFEVVDGQQFLAGEVEKSSGAGEYIFKRRQGDAYSIYILVYGGGGEDDITHHELGVIEKIKDGGDKDTFPRLVFQRREQWYSPPGPNLDKLISESANLRLEGESDLFLEELANALKM